MLHLYYSLHTIATALILPACYVPVIPLFCPNFCSVTSHGITEPPRHREGGVS